MVSSNSSKLFIFTLSIFLFGFISLSLPSALGLGLSGVKISPITYVPGQTITNHYSITETSLPTEVSLSTAPEISTFIRTTEVKNNEFDLIIEFPETLTMEPGIYSFGLSVNEVPPSDYVGVGSYVSISKRFEMNVYSYQKYLSASFEAPSVNEANPVPFQINVQSQSYADIDNIKGQITVYDNKNQELAEIITPEISLESLTSQIVTAQWNTTGLLPGDYWAKAVVFYDGKSITLNDTFKIGIM